MSLGSDGNYYDSNGSSWAFGAGGWLKVIADVRATPSDLDAYVTAYNGINAMNTALDWFLMFAIGPEDLAGAAPEEFLAKRFGVRGALMEEALLLDRTLQKIASEVGPNNVLNMTAGEMEEIMRAKGYTNSFSGSLNAAQITTTAANDTGQIAGSQLVRFGATEDAATSTGTSSGAWTGTLDQVQNADGSFMSPGEIADKFSLPFTPAYYAPIIEIPTGTTIDAGIAGELYGGNGGGFQYFIGTTNLRFGAAVHIP